jgi:DNA polymerase-3 subunit delta'
MIEKFLYKKNSQILVTKLTPELKEQIQHELSEFEIFWFQKEKILLDDVKIISDEVFISTGSEKYIIIETNEIATITQNALLKMFEEPPSNVYFLIIVPSKSILLSTIRSRFPIFELKNREEFNSPVPIPKLENFRLQDLKAFLKDVSKINHDVAIKIIEEIFIQNKQNFHFQSDDFKRLQKAIQLLNLNSNLEQIFTMFLLPIILRNIK